MNVEFLLSLRNSHDFLKNIVETFIGFYNVTLEGSVFLQMVGTISYVISVESTVSIVHALYAQKRQCWQSDFRLWRQQNYHDFESARRFESSFSVE